LPVVVAGEERKRKISAGERKGLTVDPSGRLVAEELLVAPIGCWNGGERGREKMTVNKKTTVFFLFLNPIFFIFRP